MRAFPHGDKAMYLDRVRRHREADELIRGTGWDGHRGCAVGCTLECYDHSQYPERLGVPEQLAHLQDFIFEHRASGHLEWPERFLGVIQPGADLSGVWPAFAGRMLTRARQRVTGAGPWADDCREATQTVIDLYRGGMPNASAAFAATSAAWAAASAAWAAGATSAAFAAASAASAAFAATSAAFAATSAANAAAWAADRAAWDAEIQQQADDLIELLAAAPVPEEVTSGS